MAIYDLETYWSFLFSLCSTISTAAAQMAGHTQTINVAQHYNYDPSNSSNNRLRTASLSTSDEGIVMDYSDETPRKRRVSTNSMDFSFSMLI